MLFLTACIVCDSRRTDEPELPKFFRDYIAFWMHEHDVKALDIFLDEVTDDEK